MSVRNYAILYGGKSKSSASTIGGGNALLDTGAHDLDGPEHLHPDSYVKAIGGGEDTYFAHGSTGATETIDPAVGNVHTLTLDANCTFTIAAPTLGVVSTLELYLTQDGTGSRIVTWPGSVVWPGGTAPTLSTAAASLDRIVLETLDGGTTWYGTQVGGGSTVAALDDLSDVQTSGEVAGAMLVYDGSVWRPGAPAEPLILEDGTIAILENGHAAMAEPTYL